jgi:hypothetical protein
MRERDRESLCVCACLLCHAYYPKNNTQESIGFFFFVFALWLLFVLKEWSTLIVFSLFCFVLFGCVHISTLPVCFKTILCSQKTPFLSVMEPQPTTNYHKNTSTYKSTLDGNVVASPSTTWIHKQRETECETSRPLLLPNDC